MMIIGKTAKGLLNVYQRAIENHQIAIDANTDSIQSLMSSVDALRKIVAVQRARIVMLENARTAETPASRASMLPAPKGFVCAADCGHSITVHREHGCDALGGQCECPAPHGRILPNPNA